MANIAPAELVAPIARTPLQFGLFSVVGFREGGAGRWYNGIQLETDTCAPLGAYGEGSCDPVANIPGGPINTENAPGDGETAEGTPFSVYGWWSCSPVSYSLEDAVDKARNHLYRYEEARVEQALWTGDLGNVPNFAGVNSFDAPADLGSVAVADIWRAISVAEAYIAKKYGGIGIIHMSRLLAMIAIDKSLQVRGGQLRTPLGTPIVAGTGYGSDKIVVTGDIAAYRSEPRDLTQGSAQLFNRGTNDLLAIVERDYVFAFEDCGFASVGITGAPSI